MAHRQVYHMEVIPLACPVRGGIVTAKDRKLFKFAYCHPADVGHEIIRDTVGIIAQQT